MKLRGRRTMMGLQCPSSPARPRPEPASTSLLPHHFRSLFFHPSRPSTAPACPSATDRKSDVLQLSYPSCSASPFLLHKITEAEERGGKDRGVAPSLPTQLSYPTIIRRAQLAATLAPSSNRRTVLRHLPVPMVVHPQRVEP